MLSRFSIQNVEDKYLVETNIFKINNKVHTEKCLFYFPSCKFFNTVLFYQGKLEYEQLLLNKC